MQKEEILARNRKENMFGDEREQAVRVKRDAFSLWGLVILGCVIMFLKTFHGTSSADIISLLFCTSGLAFVYEGVQLKKKATLICGAVWLAAAVYFFYRFCVGILL